MEYIIAATILTLLAIVAVQASNKRRLKKLYHDIRISWGKPKSSHFNFDLIKRYADIRHGIPYHRISDQTIYDIDFHELFCFIDRTTSKVGQQYLYKTLLEPTADSSFLREKLIELFRSDGSFRESIQLELLKLNHSSAYHISSLLSGKLLEKPKWFPLLLLDLFIVITLCILSIQFPVCLILLIIPVTLNMVLHFWNKVNAFRFISGFRQLSQLINVSKTFLTKDEAFSSEEVLAATSALQDFQVKQRLLSLDDSNGIQSELAQLAMYLVELLKAVFLIEVLTLYHLTRQLEHKQKHIITLFDYVGNIDVALSVASLRSGEKKTCKPTFLPREKRLALKNVYHPLIENCIGNDFTLVGRSVMITGSNMSGKSTFLRTVLLNSILAQTIHTCFADEYVAPILKQFSSIRIDDNLLEGKSYYFEEVEVIGGLLTKAQLPFQNVFVLDEIFKGTNTKERIAAGKAILSYLNKGDNIVIVSTHDLELADLLAEEYDLYHFTEHVKGDNLHFDHRIKSGKSHTTNAIAILELSGYPEEVIRAAKDNCAIIHRA